ncbi:MAG TPA: hypothetical protein VH105_05790 [Burkholderiales bacterium]|jgi:hypothetical protein|nr:hypothetical protein [Burkholderiales bacterium]
MATCPGCAAPLAWDARECMACKALFGESDWQPIAETDTEKKRVQAVRRVREEGQRAETLRSGQLRIYRGRRSVKIQMRGFSAIFYGALALGAVALAVVGWGLTKVHDLYTVGRGLLELLAFLALLGSTVGYFAPITLFPSGRLVRRAGLWRKGIELGTPLRIDITPVGEGGTAWEVAASGPQGREVVAYGTELTALSWQHEIGSLLAQPEEGQPT